MKDTFATAAANAWSSDLDANTYEFKGVTFYDLSYLYNQGPGLGALCTTVMRALVIPPYKYDAVVAVEARGFIFGAAFASHMGLPLLQVRKAGKLPGRVKSIPYALEYGMGTLEMQEQDLRGQHVLLIDDVLATGGTLSASTMLLKEQGAKVDTLVLLEIERLAGNKILSEAGVEEQYTFMKVR